MVPMQPAGSTQFEFVVGNRPDQLKASKLRSHLSKRAWAAQRKLIDDSTSSSSSSASSPDLVVPVNNDKGGFCSQAIRSRRPPVGPRRRKPLKSITYEYECVPAAESSRDDAAVPPTRTRQQHIEQASSRPILMDAYFGGIRVDPFRSYPGQWKPYIPALADHYIVQMARDIPELDQPGNKGLLRSTWFPLVTSSSAPFSVVMLLAAANYAQVKNVSNLGCHILRMKQEAIAAINLALRDARTRTTDSLVGAVAKMASFEAMHGDVVSYKTHMNGLVRMLSERGGLDSLGLGGLLRRIIVWIDLNSAFLLNIPRFFPGTTFTGVEPPTGVVEHLEPNPERFIAV